MKQPEWKTSITRVKPNEICVRGYRIDDLMEHTSFAEVVFLAFTGDLPDGQTAKMLNAILVSSVDHGVTPPSAIAARTAASTGAPLNAALAAGILSINDYHGGAINNCMGLLLEGIQRTSKEGEDYSSTAKNLIEEYRAAGKRIAGFGHRIHTSDPRANKLIEMAKSFDIASQGVKILLAIRDAFEASGKVLPINVDGAIAAILVDMGMPREFANAFFIIARAPGLIAHIYEEQKTQKPMRKIDVANHLYNGYEDRDVMEDENDKIN
ncbi:MAG: citryl-CoA lyase [Anaerolineaceae bacterium]|nr:citryl-CoA lyase [Anaerolineaceae bacterium]